MTFSCRHSSWIATHLALLLSSHFPVGIGAERLCCPWAQAEADLQRKHAEMMGRMRGVGMLKAAEKPSKQADDGSKDQVRRF